MARVRTNTRRLRSLIQGLEAADAVSAKAGLRRDGEAGTRRYDNGHTVMDIAPIHEFGAPTAGIPKRPVVAHVGSATGNQAAQIMLRGIKTLHARPSSGGHLVRTQLEAAARMGRRAMETRVRKPGEPPPPNAPSTVAQKGFNNPLFESGKLAASFESWTETR